MGGTRPVQQGNALLQAETLDALRVAQVVYRKTLAHLMEALMAPQQ